MESHTSWGKVHKFIGVINYQCNMCPKQSHTLAPLTKLLSIKRKFKWTKVEQDAFDKIKQIEDRDNLLTYPNFSEEFKIHIDASYFQLGKVVSQKGELIAFYSRTLTGAQQRYTVKEKKLLSIIETLKEFR